MTPSPRADLLLVDGELTADVGGLSTRLVADGRTIVWRVPDPAVALGALPMADRREVGRHADRLAAVGLTLELHDGRGPLLEAGVGTRSLIGRLLFATPTIRLRRLGAWVRIVRGS